MMNFVVIYWIMVKELEDLAWFPRIFRRFQVEFIGATVQWLEIYRPLAPGAAQLLQQVQCSGITDLCSGSGAPAIYLHRQLGSNMPLTLTDIYPQRPATAIPGITYSSSSVDVLNMQPGKDQLYTMFNAFHHFSSRQQQQLLQRFAAGKAPFLFAEILQPRLMPLLKVVFTATVGQLLLAPLVKPFSLLRLFFTWLLPVNILTVLYDGIVSVFKSKTAAGLRRLAAGVQAVDFSIRVEVIKSPATSIVLITGTPIHS